MATPVEILFNTLKKGARNGKYSTVEDVVEDVNKLSEKLSLSLSDEQIQIFSEKFYNQYVEFSDILDNLIEEPEDEIEVIKKKIAAYSAKLTEAPANRISIMSMISKLRRKLRELGEEVETVRSPKAELTEEAIRAKIEQLELDLALAPSQKRKSVQSMISKLRKKLRDMGVEEVVEKTAKPVKLTPAQKIGFDENQFNKALENAVFDSANPINKNLLLFLVYYTRKIQPDVDLIDLCKFILKYHRKDTVVNLAIKLGKLDDIDLSMMDLNDLADENSTELYDNNLYMIISDIVVTTLKNVIKSVKATATLSLNDLNSIDVSSLNPIGLKAIKKASTLKKAEAIVKKYSIVKDIDA